MIIIHTVTKITFDITKRSEDGSLGSEGLYRITRKNNTDRISAQLDEDVGCLNNNNQKLIQGVKKNRNDFILHFQTFRTGANT